MRTLHVLAPAVFLLSTAHADLTIEYKTGYEFAPGLPPAITDAMKKQIGSSVASGTTLSIKGDRVAASNGKLTFIIDYAKQEITILHPPTKRYATVPTSEFAEQVSAMIPAEARQAAQSMQIDVKVDRSGKSANYGGLAAEESVVTMEVQNPNAGGPGITMRMEIHNWIATAEAVSQHPELKQWNTRKWMSGGGMNPAEILSSAFSQGASAEKLRAAMQQMLLESTGLSVRTESRTFVPMMAQMMQMQGVQLGDGPLVTTVNEMVRYSAEPIPASTFEVPSGYQAAPVADLLQEMNPLKPSSPASVTGK